jgi:lipopolysaccharide/colanic/teichoic acid biosynthesis glycosyltransferase
MGWPEAQRLPLLDNFSGEPLASSILFSNTGAHIVAIDPDTGIVHDSPNPLALDTETPGRAPEGQQSAEDATRNRLRFSVGSLFDAGSYPAGAFPAGAFQADSFAAHGGTAATLDLAHRRPDLSLLPTRSRKYELGKRVFDVALAIAIFPVVAAILGAISALIALTSKGPIFFRQVRIGQHGRDFWIWKFRTMHPRADWILAEHLKHDPEARAEWNLTHKLRVDPRITPLGRLLRKTSLDELPQIFNVLSGDMSFVGPRPIVHAEAVKYAERFAYYLAAVPGITGLWQVSGRCNVSYEARTLLDETYVRKWSMLRDLWILLKTPREVFNRNGAY